LNSREGRPPPEKNAGGGVGGKVPNDMNAKRNTQGRVSLPSLGVWPKGKKREIRRDRRKEKGKKREGLVNRTEKHSGA